MAKKKFDDNSEPDFSIMWRYNFINDEWYISMRGVNELDLSAIAKDFGGGGHPKACGFTIPKGENLYTYFTQFT